MFMLASFLVAVVVALMAADAARRPITAPTYFLAALFLSGGLTGATYAPTENPDALRERAHAMSLAAMWAAHEDRAVDGGACRPNIPLTINKDIAHERLTAWREHADNISLR